MNSILDFIAARLIKYVDAFKLNNPGAFAVIAAILFGIFAVLDQLMTNGTFSDPTFTVFGVTFGVIGSVKYLLVALGFALGSHTTALLKANNASNPVAKKTVEWEIGKQFMAGDWVSQYGKKYEAVINHSATHENLPLIDVTQGGKHWKLVN